MLMRFDPFHDFDTVAQMLNRQPGSERVITMPMDAYRQGEQFVVHFDLPGIDPASIDLTVDKNVLTVRAERKWERSEDVEVIIVERPQGTFTRQLFLGDTLDSENIKAVYDQGVLTLRIPVAEKAKPRRVDVTTAASNPTITAPSSETQKVGSAS